MTEEQKKQGIFRKLKQGDVSAFVAFYEAHKQDKYRSDYRILRKTGSAEDAVADSFVNFWRKRDDILKKVKNYGELWAFIRKVNRNRCLEILRKEKRIVLCDDPEDLVDPEDSDGPTAPDSFGSYEQIVIRRCIEDLNPFPDRAAIICRYYWEMTYQEIANHFNYGDTNASARKAWGVVDRAKKSLLDMLETETPRKK